MKNRTTAHHINGQTEKMTKTIFLLDDHDIVRFGLAALLGSNEKFQIIGSAPSMELAISAIENLKPDLVITDLSVGDSKGLDTIRTLARVQCGRRILVLSMHDEMLYAEQAISLGANGYLMKETAQENVSNAAETVLNGDIWVSARVNSQLLKRLSTDVTSQNKGLEGLALSVRELEILGMLAAGKLTKEIAFEFGISPRTVDLHRANLKQKLGLKTAAELVAYAATRAA